jgi:ribonuclease HII
MSRLRFCLSEHVGWIIAGVDEAGRGPLAGPVYAAAVIADPRKPLRGVADSKELSPSQREALYVHICKSAASFAVASVSAREIDELNILQASLLAMHRAVALLPMAPEFIYVDGPHCPRWDYASQGVIGGDGKISAIAAASILAKVSRDRAMEELDLVYPGYGFAKHKGYGTQAHREALLRLGPCAEHRRSFRPVRELLIGAADTGPHIQFEETASAI